jgi:hypothetical protein
MKHEKLTFDIEVFHRKREVLKTGNWGKIVLRVGEFLSTFWVYSNDQYDMLSNFVFSLKLLEV